MGLVKPRAWTFWHKSCLFGSCRASRLLWSAQYRYQILGKCALDLLWHCLHSKPQHSNDVPIILLLLLFSECLWKIWHETRQPRDRIIRTLRSWKQRGLKGDAAAKGYRLKVKINQPFKPCISKPYLNLSIPEQC